MASKLRPVGCVAVKNLLGKPAGLSQQQVRTVVHRSLLRLPENYPQPWDYKVSFPVLLLLAIIVVLFLIVFFADEGIQCL